MRRASGSGHRERANYAMEPVRRSTREKRLVFTTLNVSEIDKQILDPKHGYPDVDSSDVRTCVRGERGEGGREEERETKRQCERERERENLSCV